MLEQDSNNGKSSKQAIKKWQNKFPNEQKIYTEDQERLVIESFDLILPIYSKKPYSRDVSPFRTIIAYRPMRRRLYRSSQP